MIKFIFTVLIFIGHFAKANIYQDADMICQSKNFIDGGISLRFYHISRNDWKVKIWSISPYLEKTLDVNFSSLPTNGGTRSMLYDKNNNFSLDQTIFDDGSDIELNSQEWELSVNLNEHKLIRINHIILCQ